MTESPFSKHNPRLQRAWDSVSLGALMFCPRRYQYEILWGWRENKVDLEFGIMFASAVERFYKARLRGASRDEAQLEALDWVLENSGSYDESGTWTPWRGQWLEMWHCTHNPKRGTKKCPWAHKGKWFPPPAPFTCGSCGSDTETETRWVPEDNTKNRHTLIRLVVWYCEEQPEDASAGLQPFAFPDGRPAVELSGRLPLGWNTPYSASNVGEPVEPEPYELCFHLDRLATFGDETFIVDNKTTKKTLGRAFYAGYNPSHQVSIYDLVGSVLYPNLNIRGVMIDGAQVMVSGARFGLGVVYRSEEHREEFLATLRFWLDLAERLAEGPEDYPMNERNCWLCPFKGVCAAHPSKRQAMLAEEFVNAPWNPLIPR